MDHPITSSTWKRLFSLAEAFHQLAPWKWMLEMDLFGVEHPLNGEVGYCCILGPQQNQEGLAVYKGLHGLLSYEHLFDGDADTPSLSVLHEQDCIVMVFLQEEELFEAEKELIAAHCHSRNFTGKYPVFRDYSPGWVPWPISDGFQATWMEVALEQALEVALRFRSDLDLLDHMSNSEAQVLVRRPVNPPFLDDWKDDWIPLVPVEQETILNRQLYLRSNCADLPRGNRDWLATLFYLPRPVENEAERPYLPLMVILADYLLGEVIFEKEFRPGQEDHYLQFAFVETCRKMRYLPTKLWIGEEREFQRWLEIGETLGIPVELEQESTLARELKEEYLN